MNGRSKASPLASPDARYPQTHALQAAMQQGPD